MKIHNYTIKILEKYQKTQGNSEKHDLLSEALRIISELKQELRQLIEILGRTKEYLLTEAWELPAEVKRRKETWYAERGALQGIYRIQTRIWKRQIRNLRWNQMED